MTNGKVFIVGIIVALVMFGAGILTGYIYTEKRDSARLEGYQDTIDKLGREITELENTNSELTASNQRLEKTASELRSQLDNIIVRVGDAERIISEIENGISDLDDDIQRVIRSIGSVIKKVITLGE